MLESRRYRILIVVRRHNDIKFGDNSNSLLSSSQPQNSWVNALITLGHDVEVVSVQQHKSFKSQFNLINRVRNKLSRIFIERNTIKKIRKHLLFDNLDLMIVSGGIGGFISKSLLGLIQNYSLKLIYINGTSPIYFKYEIGELLLARKSNLLITNCESQVEAWNKFGAINSIALPISACDSQLHLGKKRPSKFKYQITFVGSLDEEIYKSRLEILSQLHEFDLSIWSSSPNIEKILIKYNLLKHYKGSVSRVDLPEIYSTSILTINLHHIESMPEGGNLSTFEIPGASMRE